MSACAVQCPRWCASVRSMGAMLAIGLRGHCCFVSLCVRCVAVSSLWLCHWLARLTATATNWVASSTWPCPGQATARAAGRAAARARRARATASTTAWTARWTSAPPRPRGGRASDWSTLGIRSCRWAPVDSDSCCLGSRVRDWAFELRRCSRIAARRGLQRLHSECAPVASSCRTANGRACGTTSR